MILKKKLLRFINIKEVADYYFGIIPDKLYDGLYNYEVEIDD